MEYCNHPMTDQRLCGRRPGHTPPHRSYANIAKKLATEKRKRKDIRTQARGQHRSISASVPGHLLPGSALASLAKYRQSGMVQPGDVLFEKIALRLLERDKVALR